MHSGRPYYKHVTRKRYYFFYYAKKRRWISSYSVESDEGPGSVMSSDDPSYLGSECPPFERYQYWNSPARQWTESRSIVISNCPSTLFVSSPHEKTIEGTYEIQDDYIYESPYYKNTKNSVILMANKNVDGAQYRRKLYGGGYGYKSKWMFQTYRQELNGYAKSSSQEWCPPIDDYRPHDTTYLRGYRPPKSEEDASSSYFQSSISYKTPRQRHSCFRMPLQINYQVARLENRWNISQRTGQG